MLRLIVASPKELVECVSDVLKVPHATVVVHDRNLAMAGLRTVNGRGRAVAAVTFEDAANLLIAVIASDQVRNSVATVNAYGSLVSRGGKFFEGLHPKISRRHTFRDGLSGLIEMLSFGSFQAAGSLSIDVKIDYPRLETSVDVDNEVWNSLLVYEAMGSVKSIGECGDLSVVKRISQITLFAVAEVLRVRSQPDEGSTI